jgi:hypothetical protein
MRFFHLGLTVNVPALPCTDDSRRNFRVEGYLGIKHSGFGIGKSRDIP